MILSDAALKALLSELKAGLQAIYGERLEGVYLYGSYARGEATEESDIDLLIVLDRIERYAAEIERTGGLIASLSLECGVSVSTVLLAKRDWLCSESPFTCNVREDAVAV